MVRPRSDATPPGSPELDAEFWLRVCGDSNPTPRDRFLYLTIEEFGRLGPGRFSHAAVARKLGYTLAMINHYFGSRNGLISEATAVVYDQYIEAMKAGVRGAEKTPEARLAAWMHTQVQFAVDNAGWAVVHNYPDLALENPVEFEERFRQRMTQGFELNLGLLGQLILDVKRDSVTEAELTPENFDRVGYLSNQRLVTLVASIAMSTLGAAVWSAGAHAPSRATKEALALRDFVVAEHVKAQVERVRNADL